MKLKANNDILLFYQLFYKTIHLLFKIQFQTSDKHHEFEIKMKNLYPNLFKLLFIDNNYFDSSYLCDYSNNSISLINK